MKEASVRINNKIGIHARPAALLVSEAGKFKSSITIKKGQREADLKSIMGVLSLGVFGGEEVIIRTNGTDEEKALNTIIEILSKLED